jgi:uracil-DNA glycosylase family 4
MNLPAKLPVFGSELADCASCELIGRRDDKKCVVARPPEEAFGGLMIIGEGPGRNEVLKGRPFVGRSGQLLDALLQAAGLRREQIYVTNATLCQPPQLGEQKKGPQKGFHDRFPTAVPSCLPRLEAEIEAMRPRVIVTLGASSLVAASAYTVKKSRQVDNPCVKCHDKRKYGPAIACAVGACDWYHVFDGCSTFEEAVVPHAALLAALDNRCPSCQASIKKVRIRDIKCPYCGGKKKKNEYYHEWTYDYSLLSVAGAIFESHRLASRWDRYGVRYVIPTFHPAFLLRPVDTSTTRKAYGGQFAAQAVLDHLEKARKLLARDHEFRFRTSITDDPEDVRAYTAEPGRYTIDIETDAKSSWDVACIRCIGIGRADREEVLVVDTQRLVRNAGTDAEPRFEVVDHELMGALEDFLTATSKPKVAQNGNYDYTVIRRLWGIETAPIGGDTKVAHHVLRPDEPHELQNIAFEMTDAEHWKPPKKAGGVLHYTGFTDLAIYNARDVRATALADEAIAGLHCDANLVERPTGVPVPRYSTGGRLDLPGHGLRNVYEVDMAVLPIAIEMEWWGCPVDVEQMRAIAADTQPKVDALRREMEEWSGLSGFNPNSTPQLQFVLFDPSGPFKLTATARTETGQPSTAKDELAKLAEHPFVAKFLEWRALDKVLGTYLFGESMIIRPDGAIHPTWNTTGARTGRWSSSPNFQNWPKWLRKIVKAPQGWVFIGADESQLEARIMAALCGDPELIRRCRDADEADKLNPDKDLHSFVAYNVFGDVFRDATKDGKKALREIAKSCLYGMNYGAGAPKVREAIYKKGYDGPPISIQQVKFVIETIFRLFPGVERWREETLRETIELEQVRSAILRRWRNFPLGDVEATVAWNYPIQSTAADILNLRMVALDQRLKAEAVRNQVRFMAQVHDAIYLMAREDVAEKVAQCMGEELSIDLTLVPGAPAMPFVATPAIADNWADAA